MIEFAEDQKENPEISFDKERDKMIVVFDGDIFEEKVLDYDELIAEGEKSNILAVSHQTFISAKGSLPVISVGSLMKFEKMTENKKAQNKHSILFCTFFILNDILNR